jgi:nucleotide-binding universal stress UspA family protein
VSTVLAALDSSPCGRAVLVTAVAVADAFQSSVTGLHVLENGSSTARELADTAGVELREVGGRPVDEIVVAVDDPDVVALVLGARGVQEGPRPGGHTVLEVITRVRKPVVVVPPDAQPADRLGRILVPIEGTSDGSDALDGLLALAHRRGLEVLVLHVYSPATVPAFADHDPHATLGWEREFLSRYVSAPHDRVRLVRRVGVAAADVNAVAREASADLIVLAWSRDLVPGHALVVSETLSRSHIPVLLLPAHTRPTGMAAGATV